MKTGKNGYTTTISAIANFVINISLVKFIGLWASVISTLVSYLVLVLIRYKDIKKTLNLRIYSKSYRVLFEMIVFTVANYLINNTITHVICLILACIIVLFENYEYVPSILNKLKHKIKKKSN